MNIKKIIKRNLKNMGEVAFEIAFRPFTFGFTHASYLYFYTTREHCDDEHLENFMAAQLRDFKKAVENGMDNLYDKLDHDEEPEKWEDRIETLRKTIGENLLGYPDYADWRLLDETWRRITENDCVQRSDRFILRRLEEKYDVRKGRV